MFEELTALGQLWLGDNRLTTLSADVFDGLTALTFLWLKGNRLTSTTLPNDVFDGLTALESLHLHDNDLTALPEGVFDGLTALRQLVLYHNDLTELPDDVFEELTALSELILDDNPGAPFAPTAVALPDDGTVFPAGGTVTLDGSGSGGAWGANVTYSWALTDSPSGVTVTFDAAASATPMVTIPSLTAGAELTFTLTVTGRGYDNPSSDGIALGVDSAKVTVSNPDPQRPDGVRFVGNDQRGHGVYLRGVRLQLLRPQRGRCAGERHGGDAACGGNAGARRRRDDGGPVGDGGGHRQAGVHAGGERQRDGLCELHLQGERRHERERVGLHHDGERNGSERPGHGRADDQRDGAGGRDAEGGDHGHCRRGWPHQPHLRLPVGPGGRGETRPTSRTQPRAPTRRWRRMSARRSG